MQEIESEWVSASRIWEELYYCRRDGIVVSMDRPTLALPVQRLDLSGQNGCRTLLKEFQ